MYCAPHICIVLWVFSSIVGLGDSSYANQIDSKDSNTDVLLVYVETSYNVSKNPDTSPGDNTVKHQHGHPENRLEDQEGLINHQIVQEKQQNEQTDLYRSQDTDGKILPETNTNSVCPKFGSHTKDETFNTKESNVMENFEGAAPNLGPQEGKYVDKINEQRSKNRGRPSNMGPFGGETVEDFSNEEKIAEISDKFAPSVLLQKRQFEVFGDFGITGKRKPTGQPQKPKNLGPSVAKK
ncbi:hypothetical protein M8J77_022089 [Diaphorina citri]|nr:hypothetical protein M8J77_022089 [Diaphorina citri]